MPEKPESSKRVANLCAMDLLLTRQAALGQAVKWVASDACAAGTDVVEIARSFEKYLLGEEVQDARN